MNCLKQEIQFAQETLKITINYLAKAISGIVNTLDPEEIVIGGGVSEADQLFHCSFKRSPLRNLFFLRSESPIQIRKASLGNDAGIYGAAYQVIEVLKMMTV